MVQPPDAKRKVKEQAHPVAPATCKRRKRTSIYRRIASRSFPPTPLSVFRYRYKSPAISEINEFEKRLDQG